MKGTSEMERWIVRAAALALPLLVAGCLSPIALHRAVMAYDEAVFRATLEQLLVNIQRARMNRPLHFTRVPSVAATFDFRASGGVGPGVRGYSLIAPLFNLGAAENPTITIVPMEGEEFRQRMLTPMDESRLTSLVAAGPQLNMLLRLIASELLILDGEKFRTVDNDPLRPEGYEEFRRRVLHLASLHEAHQLYGEPVVTQKLWSGELPAPPEPRDVLEALDKGYYWTPSPRPGRFNLSRRRALITNYHPSVVPQAEEQRLASRLETWRPNEVLVDIRPGYPGGEYPWTGTIRLRSFTAILLFLAENMNLEFDVPKDPRTGPAPFDPADLLQIVETSRPHEDAAVSVEFEGRFYAILRTGPQATWNLRVFWLLYELFQMTVRRVEAPVPGITIAK